MSDNLSIYEPDAETLKTDAPVFSKWLKGVLITNITTVTFTKKDGTERVMQCTLRPDLLPVQDLNEDKTPRQRTESVMSVFDIEANGWRSFTLDAVKRVEFKINED